MGVLLQLKVEPRAQFKRLIFVQQIQFLFKRILNFAHLSCQYTHLSGMRHTRNKVTLEMGQSPNQLNSKHILAHSI